MGFGKFGKSLVKFGTKLPGNISKFGNKVIHGAEKGIGAASSVLGVMDKVAGALSGIPVVGELAGAARPFIQQGRGLMRGANNGLSRLEGVNNKIGRVRF